MYTRFMDIVNGLKDLAKKLFSNELMNKILKFLPQSWEAKVTTIE